MTDQVIEQPQAGAEPVKPAVEPDVEADEFDKERAMATIKQLRNFEKQAKSLERKLAEYEQKEKERQDAELSETERLKKQKAELEAAVKDLQRKTIQREVAEKAGLPSVFAYRLQGDTAEEMEADAKLILEALPKAGKPNVNPTNPGGNATGAGETDEQRSARIYGRNVNVFDPVTASKMGGGITFTTKTD